MLVASSERFDAPFVHQNEATHRRLIAERANASFARDGTNSMTAPMQNASYTVSTLPTASLWTGATVYVSDETGGAVMAFSDGTNWRRVTDRAVVS